MKEEQVGAFGRQADIDAEFLIGAEDAEVSEDGIAGIAVAFMLACASLLLREAALRYEARAAACVTDPLASRPGCLAENVGTRRATVVAVALKWKAFMRR